MQAKVVFVCAAIVLTGVWILSSPALAFRPDPQCMNDARDEYHLCVSNCQDGYRTDKDTCRSVNHECAEACRDAFELCVGDPLTEFGVCKANCQAALEQEKVSCRASHGRGTEELDQCIDEAQRFAFTCRDQCREDAAPALNQCREEFRACNNACSAP